MNKRELETIIKVQAAIIRNQMERLERFENPVLVAQTCTIPEDDHGNTCNGYPRPDCPGYEKWVASQRNAALGEIIDRAYEAKRYDKAAKELELYGHGWDGNEPKGEPYPRPMIESCYCCHHSALVHQGGTTGRCTYVGAAGFCKCDCSQFISNPAYDTEAEAVKRPKICRGCRRLQSSCDCMGKPRGGEYGWCDCA